MPRERVLEGLVRDQALVIGVLEQRNEALEARVLELEARLGADSRNSSRSPSSDGLGKRPRSRSLRGRSGLKPGGQLGHEGKTLRKVARPDAVVEHWPTECSGCEEALGAGHPQVGWRVRLEFELPVIRAFVAEHRLAGVECGCGKVTWADAPRGVGAPAVYGPRLRAAALYLYQGHFLAKGRTAEAVGDLFGVPISSGSVANFQKMADEGLEEFICQVKAAVRDAGVAGADETGVRMAGSSAWLHVARTDKHTVLEVHPRRGARAMRDIGVLDGFSGVLVRDALGSYDAIGAGRAGDQLCGAHLARELNAVSEFLARHPEWARTEQGLPWDWAGQAAAGLWAVKAAREASPDGVCPARILSDARHMIVSAGRIAARGGCSPPGPLGDKHIALANRIARRVDDYLRFAEDPRVPFDNNGSERDLRMAKLRMKVSGSFRDDTGADQFARLRSYLSTTAKHGLNGYDVITRIFTGNTWLPQTT